MALYAGIDLHSTNSVVVESTYNWYWLVDGLQAEGYDVRWANTSAIQQYEGLKYSDDESDARWLATLLRLGLLPEGHIYPKAERAVRDLVRKRSQLVRHRTAHILSIENLVIRNTGRRISANRVRHLTEEQVDVLLPEIDDYAGDGGHQTVCGGGELRLLLPLRQERSDEQPQEEGKGECQEREQVSFLGLHRGGDLITDEPCRECSVNCCEL